jgi:phospholipid transport system substrate-binding protein
MALLAVVVPSHGAQGCPSANPDEARALVRDTTEEVLAAVEANRESIEMDPRRARDIVEEHITPHVDLEAFSRLVLGKHWRKATPEQRQRFLAEFHTLILRTYATAVTHYNGAAIEYLPPRKESRDTLATVKTRFPQREGPGISVDYRLRCRKGEWKLFDVVIQGVSMVTTYRNTFAAEVKKSGVDGLIDILTEKNRAASR